MTRNSRNSRALISTLVVMMGAALIVIGFSGLLGSVTRASEQTVTQTRLLNNATATATTAPVVGGPMANCRETAIYVAWATGVTSGAVTVETAVDANYTGTWAPLQVVTFSATAPKQDVVQITGIHWAIRTRISTVVVGNGNGVTTWLVCN